MRATQAPDSRSKFYPSRSVPPANSQYRLERYIDYTYIKYFKTRIFVWHIQEWQYVLDAACDVDWPPACPGEPRQTRPMPAAGLQSSGRATSAKHPRVASVWKALQRTLNASWDNQEIWNRGIFSVPICENLLHPLWIWAQVAQGFQCAWNAVYGQTLCQHCVDGRKKQQKGEMLNKYRTAPPHDLRRNTAAMWPLPLLGGYSIDPCVAWTFALRAISRTCQDWHRIAANTTWSDDWSTEWQ